MDTNRIVINNYDLSTATVEKPTSVTGFTVIKSPKGPKTPVRIPAGGSAIMKDIFGVSSKEYPEIYEAEYFNKEYDLYVSAPYTAATVPVAYLTELGVFPGAEKAKYNEKIEQFIAGNLANESEVEPLLIPNGQPKVLVDTRYPRSNFGLPYRRNSVETETVKQGLDESEQIIPAVKVTTNYPSKDIIDTCQYPKYENKNLIIHTGMTKKMMRWDGDNFSDDPISDTKETDGKLDIIPAKKQLNKIRISHLPEINGGSEYVDLIIAPNPSNTAKIKIAYGGKQEVEVGDVKFEPFADDPQRPLRHDETTEPDPRVNEEKNKEVQEVVLYLTGEHTVGKANTSFTDTFIQTLLSQDVYRSKLTTSWIYDAYDTDEKTTMDPITKKVETKKIYVNKVAGVIFPKFPTPNTTHISFMPFNPQKGYANDDFNNRNIVKMIAYEDGAFHDKASPISIIGSVDLSAHDANGAYIGFNSSNDSYVAQQLLSVYVPEGQKFTSATELNTLVNCYPPIELYGGTKSFTTLEKISDGLEVEVDGQIHQLGWEAAASEEFSDVDLFFDSTRHSAIPSETDKFYTLANIHKLAGYIFNYTVAPNVVSMGALSDALRPLTYGYNYWNICNEALITLPTAEVIISPLTGARALMQARIIKNRYGGVAPMYLNSGTPPMGGQLGINVKTLVHRYNKDQQMILDDYNYNPVINDAAYKVMLVGQKTCKAGAITDWSYIGHVSSFLTFQKEVKRYVMIPQLGKPNNDHYRSLRKQQVESILSGRLNGNDRIWTAAKVDTSTNPGVNDAQARNARKFIINVKVKVDIYSEFIELNFTNVDQATNL